MLKKINLYNNLKSLSAYALLNRPLIPELRYLTEGFGSGVKYLRADFGIFKWVLLFFIIILTL